jgi:GT2 family glycosyltransferase
VPMLARLPSVPTLEEFDRQLPRFEPLADSPDRPFWSVMIPTFNRPEMLTQTLESVLSQDPGPAEMQIEVCDNCSDVADIGALVRKVGKGRVEYFRQPKPGSDNVNTCIRRSRGRWVHILHDDDWVLPGFYKAYRQVIETADIEPVMVVGRGVYADEHSRWLNFFGPLPTHGTNLLADFTQKQFSNQLAQYCANVVQRSTYEKVGGFAPSLTYASDWEMWFRASLVGPVAGTHQPLAVMRLHSGQDQKQRAWNGDFFADRFRLLHLNRERLARAGLPIPPVDLRQQLAWDAGAHAWALDSQGSTEGRLKFARIAWRLDPSLKAFDFLARSWLKHWLRFNRSSAPVIAPAQPTS